MSHTPAPPAPPALSHRPLRFLVVGVWNTVFGFAAYAACYGVAHYVRLPADYVFATVPAQVLAVTNAYVCHRLFVFGPGSGVGTSLLRFNTYYWVSYVVNSFVLLPVLVTVTALSPLLVAGGLAVVNAALSYVVHARWSFAPSRPA